SPGGLPPQGYVLSFVRCYVYSCILAKLRDSPAT
ncbi:unnamed protein product, partial [marine sediment metagenome]